MTVPVANITTTIKIESIGATDASRGTTQVKAFVEELGIKQYSTPIFVKSVDAAQMLAGDTYLVTLLRGNLKPGKDKNYASNYYWDYAGPGDPNAVAAAAEAPPATQEPLVASEPYHPAPSPPPRPAAYVSDWDKHTSIQRQVAAKAATEILISGILTPFAMDYPRYIIPEGGTPLAAPVPLSPPLPHPGIIWDGWFELIIDRIENGPYVAPDAGLLEPEPSEEPEAETEGV